MKKKTKDPNAMVSGFSRSIKQWKARVRAKAAKKARRKK